MMWSSGAASTYDRKVDKPAEIGGEQHARSLHGAVLHGADSIHVLHPTRAVLGVG